VLALLELSHLLEEVKIHLLEVEALRDGGEHDAVPRDVVPERVETPEGCLDLGRDLRLHEREGYEPQLLEVGFEDVLLDEAIEIELMGERVLQAEEDETGHA